MEEKKKKKNQGGGLTPGFGVIISLLIAVMIFSGYKVFTIEKGYHEAKVSYEAVADQYTSVGPVPTEEPEVEIERVESSVQMEKQVDFDKLLSEVNNDVVAWIYCPDTVIDYPVVQGNDNEHYLHYNINGHESASGTIFLESRVRPDFSDTNNVLHGHHMMSGAMFASLDKWQSQEYYQAHPRFYLNTVYGGDFVCEVVAAFNTRYDSIIYQFAFPSMEETQNWIDAVWAANKIQPEVPFDANDRFLTLSTCAYDLPNGESRSVLILKLVPAR